jgi:hypothetical protein
MTGVGRCSQLMSLNSLNLIKFYYCKPKSTFRGSLIKKIDYTTNPKIMILFLNCNFFCSLEYSTLFL